MHTQKPHNLKHYLSPWPLQNLPIWVLVKKWEVDVIWISYFHGLYCMYVCMVLINRTNCLSLTGLKSLKDILNSK